ncbi:MAG: hypothetical protein EP330_06965 [Deltaproteobacteria bacterium]|nr:MAG: hypothetical protein EP330_06965 [Deltaproteobacteria bacterium]
MIPLLLSLAHATTGFTGTPEAVFTEDQAHTQDGAIRLWSSVERYADPDTTLFQQEAFNSGLAWPNADYAPWIASSFGTSTPHSGTFLLHVGPSEAIAEGTPILMVPGAGDNGSRGFVTMATRMDRTGRPVYALTFAHPHGDVFMQAEVVADAIEVIKQHTGAAQVDVVAHSKGGMAAVTYASHEAGASWGDAAYEEVGTPYRGDIRRMVLIATPLDGIDTAYRYSSGNLLSTDVDGALAPSAWNTYYPNTTANVFTAVDLADIDFLSDGADHFPGQRQILKRQPYPLPGSQSNLMGYALQVDWYTTYEGGVGYYSSSDGIDDAIADGGDFVDTVASRGVDPGIEIFLLAGKNPLMPNGDAALAETFADQASASEWAQLITAVNENGVEVLASTQELKGLEDGQIILGEVTGASDGLVFVSSATDEAALTARGAVVVETKIADLSHVDLLYASPITGQLLVDASSDAPENGWMEAFGNRYTEADTLGWVERVLADEDNGGDSGDSGDTGPFGTDDDGPTPGLRPCGGCSAASPLSAALWPLFIALIIRRRS